MSPHNRQTLPNIPANVSLIHVQLAIITSYSCFFFFILFAPTHYRFHTTGFSVKVCLVCVHQHTGCRFSCCFSVGSAICAVGSLKAGKHTDQQQQPGTKRSAFIQTPAGSSRPPGAASMPTLRPTRPVHTAMLELCFFVFAIWQLKVIN